MDLRKFIIPTVVLLLLSSAAVAVADDVSAAPAKVEADDVYYAEGAFIVELPFRLNGVFNCSVTGSHGDETVPEFEVRIDNQNIIGMPADSVTEGTYVVIIKNDQYIVMETVKVEFSVDYVSLDTHSKTLDVGDSFRLKATVYPEDASDRTVVWTSDDSGVASVDGNGKVTAVGEGTAKITVRTNDGGRTDSCTVTVKAGSVGPGPSPDVPKPVLKEIVVSGDYRTEYEVGDELDTSGVVVTAVYTDNSTAVVTGQCTFSPTVFALPGTVPVEVVFGSAKATFTVTVDPEPTVPPEENIDRDVSGGEVTAEESEEIIAGMESLKEQKPDAVPQVTLRSGSTDTVSVPSSLMSSVRDNGAVLSIDLASGSVMFYPKSLSGMDFSQSEATVITIEGVSAPSQHQAFVGESPVYDIKMEADGRNLGEFGDNVTVSIPYKVPQDMFLKDLRVYYLADDGKQVRIGDVAYSDGKVVFNTTHFSLYTVVCTPEDVVPEPSGPSDEDDGGDSTIMYVLCAVVILAAVVCAFAFLRRKRSE